MDSPVPKIEKLLEGQTVFVLGAGSSKPYEFPLWEELKQTFVKQLEGDFCRMNFGTDTVEFWKSALNKEEGTVDSIAFSGTDEARQLYQYVITHSLLECEKQDVASKKCGWIEQLANCLVARLISSPIDERIDQCRKICFVSMNYDRLFLQRFQKTFASRVFSDLGDWERKKLTSKYGIIIPSIAYPHGVLGVLPDQQSSPFPITVEAETFLGTPAILSYGGTIDESDRSIDQSIILAVDSFDDDPDSGSRGYQLANTYLKSAQNVLIIGMSEKGWINSKLEKTFVARSWSTKGDVLQRNIVSTDCYADELIQKICGS